MDIMTIANKINFAILIGLVSFPANASSDTTPFLFKNDSTAYKMLTKAIMPIILIAMFINTSF